MSLWYCNEHGLTAPEACCSKAQLTKITVEQSRAELTPERLATLASIDWSDCGMRELSMLARSAPKLIATIARRDMRIADLERRLVSAKAQVEKVRPYVSQNEYAALCAALDGAQPCKACDGVGWLGKPGKISQLCTDCGGSGLYRTSDKPGEG